MRYRALPVSLVLLLGLPGPLVWGKPAGLAALDRQVEQQVERQVVKQAQAPAGFTQRQQQIIRALDKVRLKLEDPKLQDHVMWFEEFELKNQSVTQETGERLRIFEEIGQEMTEVMKQELQGLKTEMQDVVTVKEERPNYGKESKGVSYIYLTDYSGHSTQSIVNEVKEVMRSVRQANPQARILLALEAAQMRDFAAPIRFAKRNNERMEMPAPYDQLFSQADKLNMDILALDDTVVWNWEGGTGYKIGDILLYVDVPLKDMTQEQWLKIDGFVSVSTLGMKQRNKQWVSYIRAVKPFYDVVIAYAGNGHINSSNLPENDIPVQLGGKHTIFEFYTLEANQESDAFGDNTYEMLCDANACVMPLPEPEEEPEPNPSSQGAEVIEWDGQRVAYEKTDMRAFKKYVSLLPPASQRRIEAVMEKSRKAGFKDVEPLSHFTVYLPDVTRPAGQ